MDTKDNKKQGVYLSNFVAIAISFFVLVLAFATGFFARSYFKEKPTANTTANVQPTKVTIQPKKSAASLDKIKEVFNKSVIKFGDPNSKVIFIEISDPSCPFCSAASGTNEIIYQTLRREALKLTSIGGTYVAPVEEMKKLVDDGKASYALLYRNGHGSGEMGMKALYCAFELGKFWPVNDLIMNNDGYNLLNTTVKNDKNKVEDLVAFLKNVVDQNKLRLCLKSGKYDTRLQEDETLGNSLDLGGTPNFYVNNMLFEGAYSFTDIKPTVDSFLK